MIISQVVLVFVFVLCWPVFVSYTLFIYVYCVYLYSLLLFEMFYVIPFCCNSDVLVVMLLMKKSLLHKTLISSFGYGSW